MALRHLTFGLLLVLLPLSSLGSFCGPASVPFSFESLPDGHPVLGCARPKCFGSTFDGKPAGSPTTFYKIGGVSDGYFRKNAEAQPGSVPAIAQSFFQTQVAKCASAYDSEQCNGANQWVGGIGPVVNVSGLPLALQCCEYELLKNSADRGIAVVGNGQIVIGGEIQTGERVYAFDYISDVVKKVKGDGSVSYDVSVRRMPCVPQPREFAVDVDQKVYEEISTRFERPEKQTKGRGAIAFQAPIQVGGQQPLQEIGGGQQPVGQGTIVSQTNEVVLQPTGQERVEVVQGPFVAEPDAIVEEVEAVEGLELPPGQVPQGLIEPPAQPAAPAYGAPAYSGGYGSGGGGGSQFCFTADTMVRLANGQKKRMDELKRGDWVLSANSSQMIYANVESWIHRMPEVEADFHRIELVDGKVLKLTSKHYLYKTECTAKDRPVAFEKLNPHPVYAERVEVGDCLYVIPENEMGYFVQKQVKKVEIVTERGIYAPMTSNGDVVVNDVLASCFNILNNRVMQQSFIDVIRSLPSLRWLFGENDDQISDLPFGTRLIVEFMDYVLPTSFLSV